MKASHNPNQTKGIETLLRLLEILRSENGCPWDKAQNYKSLAPLFLEEAYELEDILRSTSYEHLEEELGDILLHVVFIAQIANEKKHFDFESVTQKLAQKIIRRHPHVFSKQDTKNKIHSEDVERNWESIKKTKENKTLFEGIPKALPALKKAQKIQTSVSRLGLDWQDHKEPKATLKETFNALTVALEDEKPETIKEKLGDMFFNLVDSARQLNIDAEEALQQNNEKMKHHFKSVIKKENKH